MVLRAQQERVLSGQLERGRSAWHDLLSMKRFCLLFLVLLLGVLPLAGELRVFPEGQLPKDRRLQPLKDLNGHFPFAVPNTLKAWETRAAEVRQRVRVATGMWPMPERTPLNAVIHGKVEREGFTVEKVYFESVPGFYVTGLLFRPTEGAGPFPGVLSPHGHGGRLQDHGPEKIRDYIADGAERFESSGRFPKVARCAQLARMGCVTFLYDMIGYADNQQLSLHIGHRIVEARAGNTSESWGLYSAQAESRLQSVLGLQMWNSVRALDFLEGLPDVDSERLAVTGGSGGGTQTILLGALDERPVTAFPQGMVSTAMQGGCTCENTSLLRIGTGNVELAALFAPRPQAMTAANDWTKAMMTDGYPELQKVYQFYNAKDAVDCTDHTRFPHNYNYVSRALMYGWFNKHLKLGLEEPIVEADFPMLTAEEHAVWDADHPKPEGGEAFEKGLMRQLAASSDNQVAAMLTDDLRAAWTTLIGRSLPKHAEIETDSYRVEALDDGRSVSLGVVRSNAHGEEIPVAVHLSKGRRRHFALWVHGEGKAGVDDGARNALLDGGVTVVTPDLFGQGEFVQGEGAFSRNRNVENKRAFAGYTYGYNDTLFAQRVHDVLTVLASMTEEADSITLIGSGGAGPVAAVAAALAGDAVSNLALDTGNFRFAKLTDYRDVNFLPGAVKYGDLPAVLNLCSPKATFVRTAKKPSGDEAIVDWVKWAVGQG